MSRGIVVASDARQEWLLSWWWENYRLHNSLPVCFADFGMTEHAKQWCRKRGTLMPISIDNYEVKSKEEIPATLRRDWDEFYWETRNAWFKKPFALLNAPFDEALWLDLDCEVVAPIEEIFKLRKNEIAIYKVKELEEGKKLYNSGVIVFRKNAPLLKIWAECSLKENGRFLSDQDVLSEIIFRNQIAVDELPEIYNWQMCRGVSLFAKILHWSAFWGKEYIQKFKLTDNSHNI